MKAIVKLSKNETAFVAQTIGAAWAEDVQYGSGTALIPLMQQLAWANEDGCEIDVSPSGLRGIGVVDVCNPLEVYDPSDWITEDERDALVARIKAARQ